MTKSPFHKVNPDVDEDDEGQELEGAVESNHRHPGVHAPVKPDNGHDGNSPDGEQG